MQTSIGLIPKPTFFYRVSETVLALDEKHELVKSFQHEEDFMDEDLFIAREAAVDYYNSHALNGPQGDFVYPFILSGEYEEGVPFAVWFILFYIVEYYGEDSSLTTAHPLADNRNGECEKGLKLEQELLQELR
jgi:hypothetical protein